MNRPLVLWAILALSGLAAYWAAHRFDKVFDTRAIDAAVRVKAESLPEAPAGAVVFVGDSLTAGLDVAAIAPGALNYGVPGMRTDALMRRVRSYGLRDARLVVLTIGTNDISVRRLAGVELRLGVISASIPGPLIWNAVPITDRGERKRVNRAIKQLCAARRNCTFVDTPFTAGDFTDGIHLTPAGYARWAAQLAPLYNRHR